MPRCLTLSILRYGSRVKWSNPGKGVAPSPTSWCSSYRKRRHGVILATFANFTYVGMFFFVKCFFCMNLDERQQRHILRFFENFESHIIVFSPSSDRFLQISPSGGSVDSVCLGHVTSCQWRLTSLRPLCLWDSSNFIYTSIIIYILPPFPWGLRTRVKNCWRPNTRKCKALLMNWVPL